MLQSFGHLPIGWLLIAVLSAAGFIAFYIGRTDAAALAVSPDNEVRLRSQPNYHGYYLAICTTIPAALVFIVYLIIGHPMIDSQLAKELPDWARNVPPLELQQYLDRVSDHAHLESAQPTGNLLFDAASVRHAQLSGQMRLLATCLALLAAYGGLYAARRVISAEFNARTFVENGVVVLLFACAGLAILTTVGIVASLVVETVRFFSAEDGPSVLSFLFGTEWNAQTGENFGALPLFFGTAAIALIAMAVAAPIGLFSAIYLSEYASQRTRDWVKPILELLAGIPTVVYGFFAMMVVAPIVRAAALWANSLPFVPDGFFAAQPTSALAAGLVMGIMIIPFVSSLSDDVINAVPQSLRDGALAMGSTQAETIKQVVLPAALPGITAAFLLAISRAIGETMIVVMAAGQRAQITADPTSDLTTITVQIVALLTGDTEFDSAKTLSAFALGFVLFVITLGFNLIALHVVQRYREKYD
ncbi:MAG: phosphate ABC transporter permease subunit PstC [Pseudomonadota bacterium]